MKIEDLPEGEPAASDRTASSERSTAGFVAGVVFGAFLGAGFALLFAPDRGEKTRGRLSRKIRSLQGDALEGIDRAGNRTRKELRRRQRRIKAELARARARAERALD
ncbi:MAG TPA: YtxH domain-containing protein [Gemmatimonadales bacterium]|nr:YtxH domain-containing protein [Gemmatimonadales bacterium]